jgi:hypothetical protein
MRGYIAVPLPQASSEVLFGDRPDPSTPSAVLSRCLRKGGFDSLFPHALRPAKQVSGHDLSCLARDERSEARAAKRGLRSRAVELI